MLMELVILVLVLALVAYCVQFLPLPEPYGRVLQTLLILILIFAILRFALGGNGFVLR